MEYGNSPNHPVHPETENKRPKIKSYICTGVKVHLEEGYSVEGLVSETDEVCSHASTNDPLVGQPSQLVVNLCEGSEGCVCGGVSVSV